MWIGDFNISPPHFYPKSFGQFKIISYLCTTKQKDIKNMKIKNITWETDGEEQESLGLPYEVDLPDGIDPKDDDAINNYLSDTYGWLVIDWYVE